MGDFVENFENLVAREEKEIARREAEAKAQALAADKAANDELQAFTVAERIAIASRTETFNYAWLTAELLKAAGVQPQAWTGLEPIYSEKTFFSPSRQIGTRPTLELLGWPLLQWDHLSDRQEGTYTLALTPTGTAAMNDNLVYFLEEEHDDDDFDTPPRLSVKPGSLKQLPRTPLVEEDMLWPIKWKDGDEYNYQNRQYGSDHRDFLHEQRDFVSNIRTEHSDTWIGGDELTFRVDTPDYETYNKARIDDRIIKELARLAAKHHVVPTKRQLAEAQKQRALTASENPDHSAQA